MRQRRLTADKRQNFIFPKLPSATSFIRKTLSEIVPLLKTFIKKPVIIILMQEKAILTVGVVIKKGNKILLVQHGEKASHLTGVYGLPAGRPRNDEDLIEACIREVKEETGLVINKKDLRRLPSVYYAEIKRKGGTETFVIIPFITTKFSGRLISRRLILTAETIPRWIDIKEARNLELLPNVKEIIEEILE